MTLCGIPRATIIDGNLPEDVAHLPNGISEAFVDKNIFITGGSGFLGKVLIEKILRKCPDVKNIYLLLRSKKGKSPEQRITELFESQIFDLMKSLHGAGIINKVVCVAGDVTDHNFGLSLEDANTLIKSVEIFYHCAATIRFDEDLKKAVFLNTRGTKYAIELAKQMVNLKAFMYVSTSYCHLNERVLLEKPYPSPADPDKIIRLMELMDDDVAKDAEKRILGEFPNSYAYTKNLAEALVVKAMEDVNFPGMIARPSIVIPIWKEPLPGWTDNLNGPTGLLIGAGKGVIRSMYCNNEGYADYLPVDIAVNGMMVGVWNYVVNGDKERSILHLTSSDEWKVTWQEIIDIGRSIITKDIPLNGAVWYPGGSMKKSKTIHKICVFFFHTIPAHVLDFFIIISGNKPVLRRVQDRINKGFDVFEYYANNQWDFRNEHSVYIRKVMNKREKLEYKVDGDGMDIREYFKDCVMAARIYILKEMPESIPGARRHMTIMYYLDLIAKILFFGCILWMLVKVFSFTLDISLRE